MNGPSSHLDLQSSHRCIYPAKLVTLMLFSSTFVGSGMAQVDGFTPFPDSFPGYIVPAIVIPGMCLLFCGMAGLVFCCARKNCGYSTSRVTTLNAGEVPTQQVIHPQATSSANTSQPNPYPVQSNYPQPVPSQPPYTEPQRVPLPEATLHQGDAPPGYVEAIKFTTVTVNIDGRQNVTSATDKPS